MQNLIITAQRINEANCL